MTAVSVRWPNGICCRSRHLCAVLSSRHPAGPARLWSIGHVDPTKDRTGRQSAFYTVSCSTTKLCCAFDSEVAMVSNPMRASAESSVVVGGVVAREG
jgi:hypothetical protein